MAESTNATYKDRPSIKVYYDANAVQPEKLTNLLLGIEEEGIPYDLAGVSESDVFEIGFKACNDSRLGVGIGVSEKKLILHFEKLKKKRPIFEIGSFEKENYRILGSNAARLVKKMPFKEFC
jgi:hypothetical protein